MTIHNDWHIKTRSRTCCQTGREFADGEHFYTAIFEDPEIENHFLRKDFSEEAWESIEDLPKPFSFWRSKYEAPPATGNRDVVEKESAESLLHRLIEEDDSSTENARYVLAVMLERKKIFKQTDCQNTGSSRLLIYERHKTGDVFIVKDPQLKLSEVESVQAEVGELLGGRPATSPGSV